MEELTEAAQFLRKIKEDLKKPEETFVFMKKKADLFQKNGGNQLGSADDDGIVTETVSAWEKMSALLNGRQPAILERKSVIVIELRNQIAQFKLDVGMLWRWDTWVVVFV
jgi:hypothetical protein